MISIVLVEHFVYSNCTALPERLAVFTEKREQVPFRIDMENVELVHLCCPQHLNVETSRIKQERGARNKEVPMAKLWLGPTFPLV